jgi:phenylacetate-CoA ligase
MKSYLLNLYHGLPVPARSVAASLRGYYLRWWRYGPETEHLIEAALEREQWSQKRWKEWQEERLAFVLNHAATRVPYYRDQWAARRRKGDSASWEYLENWPILEKESLRQNPTAFLAEGRNSRRMYHLQTSGTTGKSLELWYSRKTAQEWYALYEARVKRWNSVSTKDNWAILGGQVVTPFNQSDPPFWVWNSALNQLYMSSYHLAPRLIRHYIEALRRYQIKYILGYTSSLYAIAQEVLLSGRGRLNMTVVITNAEPVLDYQQEAISEAFQCPVRETYGMTEIVIAAGECHQGRLHLWPEVGWLELLECHRPAHQGAAGDLVCTGFLNLDMPLIRYRVGDRAAMYDESALCSCGRTLPMLAAVEGRLDDVLYTIDGRRVGRLDTVFKARLPIREAQIIQETLQKVRVRYVPAPDFTPEAGRSIIEHLQMRMGPVEITLEQMSELPRGANGKLRAVICSLPAEQRQALNRANP